MNSFVFYESWWIAIANLSRDIQGEVLTAIVEYGLTGSTTERPKPIANAILSLIKGQIDADSACYENSLKRGNPNFKKGSSNPYCNDDEALNNTSKNDTDDLKGNRKGIERELQENKNESPKNSPESENDGESGKDEKESTKEKEENTSSLRSDVKEKKSNTYVLEKKENRRTFKRPSLDEVKAYWDEKTLQGNPEQFYDHFTSNGWLVSGRAPMKDWRAAARYWGRNSSRYSVSSFSRGRDMNDPYQNGQILIGARDYSGNAWDAPDHSDDGSIPLSEINNSSTLQQK